RMSSGSPAVRLTPHMWHQPLALRKRNWTPLLGPCRASGDGYSSHGQKLRPRLARRRTEGPTKAPPLREVTDSWRSGTSTRKPQVALRAAAYPISTPKPTAPQPFQYHRHRREHGLSRSSTRKSRPGNGGLLWRWMSNGHSHVLRRNGIQPCAG